MAGLTMKDLNNHRSLPLISCNSVLTRAQLALCFVILVGLVYHSPGHVDIFEGNIKRVHLLRLYLQASIWWAFGSKGNRLKDSVAIKRAVARLAIPCVPKDELSEAISQDDLSIV